MPIRIEGGHDHGVEGEMPAALDAPGGPYASIFVGPLLMALPIPDTDPNTPEEHAVWQYAFDLPDSGAVRNLAVTRSAMPARWDWPLRAPLELSLPAAQGGFGADAAVEQGSRELPEYGNFHAAQTARRRIGRDDQARALWLHEVPHFDVPPDQTGRVGGRVAESGTARAEMTSQARRRFLANGRHSERSKKSGWHRLQDQSG